MCREYTIYSLHANGKVGTHIGEDFEPCESHYTSGRCKDVGRYLKYIQTVPSPPPDDAEIYLPTPAASPAPTYTTKDMTPVKRSCSPSELYRTRDMSPVARYKTIRRTSSPSDGKKSAKRRKIWCPILSPLATITIEPMPRSKRRNRFVSRWPSEHEVDVYSVRPYKDDSTCEIPYRVTDYRPYYRGRRHGSDSSGSSSSDSDFGPPPAPTPPRRGPSPGAAPLKSAMKQPMTEDPEKDTPTPPTAQGADKTEKPDANKNPSTPLSVGKPATVEDDPETSPKIPPDTLKAAEPTALTTPPPTPPLMEHVSKPLRSPTSKQKQDTPLHSPASPKKARSPSPEQEKREKHPSTPPPSPKKDKKARHQPRCHHKVFTRGCEECKLRVLPPVRVYGGEPRPGYAYMSGVDTPMRGWFPTDGSVRYQGGYRGSDGVYREWEWPPRRKGDPPTEWPEFPEWTRWPFRRTKHMRPRAKPEEHIHYAESLPRVHPVSSVSDTESERRHRRRHIRERTRSRSV